MTADAAHAAHAALLAALQRPGACAGHAGAATLRQTHISSLLFAGVAFVVAAILLSALAYSRLPTQGQRTTSKGIVLSVVAGVLMGFFYRFVAASMSADFINLEAGKLGPYTAIVLFSAGLLASNFLWNSLVMMRPLARMWTRSGLM